MRKGLILILLCFFAIVGCDDPIVPHDQNDVEIGNLGILDIFFVYNIQGIPVDRIKRVDLSLAHTADSLYRGDFFTSINVSDAITKYRFFLPPADYYYQATIVCLAGGDSCLYLEFPGGQYGLRMSGGKIELVAGETTEITTAFQ